MRDFTARGGWWVAAQVPLFGGLLAFWLLWGDGWGAVALVAGAALAGAGGALVAGGLAALGSQLTPFPAPLHGGALVERGAYRLVRHPIYGGILLGALGVSLADGNWPGLVLAAALGGLFWAKSWVEEGMLATRFATYAAYRARVRRRLIPGIL
ncbi:MAG: isoprenylcysteine carboxylmethyltransferase family protein [Acidimicrobiia bacterium]|nr:isoprenylcysteine carboxylmethyltransferase family protein [Acidimicrobiia bacterium]